MGPKLAVFACLLALPLAACGTAERERDAATVVERFHAALESGDGQAACQDLGEETVSRLEQQEQKPCEQAIVGLKLPKGGTAGFKAVDVGSAYVSLAHGSVDFLNEGPEGWKISAAGCRPTAPDQPYDCELED